ncbi:MAG: hypothetical protein IKU45_05300, partial [Clostridia bacterium]|nr:hypothetical protein [Clostridia bacterium]
MKKIALVTLFLLCAVLLFSCGTEGDVPPEIDETERIEETEAPVVPQEPYFNYKDVPEYDGKTPYTIVNGNKPFFDKSEFGKRAFESYGKLDNLGRCTTVSANIGKELMPKKSRESIASVKPTGWQIAQYDCVDGTFL